MAKIRAEQCRGHCFSKVYIVILNHAEKSEERDFGFITQDLRELSAPMRWKRMIPVGPFTCT